MIFLLKGILISLIFGIPVGAVGTLSIKRTIENGFWSGFVTGLGCVLADVIYASLCIFGVEAATSFIQKHSVPIRIIGCAIVIAYGIYMIAVRSRKTALSENKSTENIEKKLSGGGAESPKSFVYYFKTFLSAFVVAILNPVLIASFFIAFSIFGIDGSGTFTDNLLCVAGIVVGALIWWVTICLLVSKLRTRLSERTSRIVFIALGIIMILIGAGMILSILF